MERGAAAPSEPVPRSARGVRTRAAIVRAARDVFERDGFVDSRIVDIAATAGVALGSFYTYFRTKEQVLAAVLAELQEEILHPTVSDAPAADPVAAIEAANRAYLVAYRRNAALMSVLDQVAAVNADVRAVRLERNRAFAERNARAIRRLQEQGLADRDLDPMTAAMAMGGMVARMANLVFVHGYDLSLEELVATLTRLWANAVGLRTGAGRA